MTELFDFPKVDYVGERKDWISRYKDITITILMKNLQSMVKQNQ